MELRASLELKGMHRDAIQVGIFRFLSSVDRQKTCSHKDTAHRVQVVQVVLWRLAETLKINDIVKPQVFKMNFALKQISQGQYLMSLPRNSISAGLVCGVLYIEATLLLKLFFTFFMIDVAGGLQQEEERHDGGQLALNNISSHLQR